VTPLGRKIAALIRQNGPMSIGDYMAICLGDPELGYYMRREPFGRGGDFVTAPEVSQIFGELVGAWLVATWQAMGSPARFALVELGPGRGTLMKDILRVARIRPAFLAAAELHLVETSPRLREAQREALAGFDVTWHASASDLPEVPALLVANEFFDALPVRQFAVAADGWAERVIGLAEDGALAFGLRPVGNSEAGVLRVTAPQEGGAAGAIFEVSPASTAIAGTIAAHLSRSGGAALIIDYGYEGPAIGETLQAVARHRYVDPLESPGEADLTAHVDFAALATAARREGGEPRPLMTQGEFLVRLGLGERADGLKRGKDAATVVSVDAAVSRLAGPEAMGNLFKVLAISSRGLVLPAFDDNSG